MSDEGITNGTYAPTTDSALTDFKKFRCLLRHNFKDKFSHYKDMKIRDPFLINLVGYMLLQKLISLIR